MLAVIFEPVLADEDGVGVPAPLTHQRRAGLQTDPEIAAWGAFLELCRQALQAAPQRPARLAIASLLQLMREGSDDQITTEAWRWLGAMQLAPPHPQILRGAIDQFGNFAFDIGDVGTAPSVVPIAAAVGNGRRPARVLASRSVVDGRFHTLAGSAMR